MLSFLYVYSDHSILECYNLFSGVELSMRSFFVILSLDEADGLIRNCYHFNYERSYLNLCMEGR